MSSSKKYTIQNSPFIVPTTDGKLIEEHFGNATTQDSKISIAHMICGFSGNRTALSWGRDPFYHGRTALPGNAIAGGAKIHLWSPRSG